MASLDTLRHASIGQYYPADSPVHRLDPRAKIVGLALFMIAIIVASTYTANLVLLMILLLLVLISQLPLGMVVRNLVPALPVIAAFAVLQLVFYGRGFGSVAEASRVLLEWGPLVISTAGVRLVAVSLVRLLSLLIVTALLTNTTTVGGLTRGTESLLRPLSRLGLPAHELAMIAAIALRFMPIFGEQIQTIAQAQDLRRVDVVRQRRWQVAQNARRLAALIIPLFADAYRRTDEMTAAMLARCYQGGRGRTHLVELRFRPLDLLFMWGSLLIVVGIVALQRSALP